MGKKSLLRSTLIIAVDLGGGYDGMDAWNFLCRHRQPHCAGLAKIKDCLTKAWKEWSRTREGRAYIARNGTNWGDCTAIPEAFLRNHGIYSFSNAAGMRDDGQLSCINIKFDSKYVVDHNCAFAHE